MLLLRLGAGGMLAAHGAQKLFGSFDGPGIEGMSGYLESMGLKPGKSWATMAGISEFGGGALMALGLGGPLGPIALQGAMAAAIRRQHWKLPLFSASGGPESPLLYGLIGLAVGAAGPGRYSLDRALGVRTPRWLSLAAATAVGLGVALSEWQAAAANEPAAADEASTETPKGDDSEDVPNPDLSNAAG